MKVFIDRLYNNIKNKLIGYDIYIIKDRLRMFIDIKDYNEAAIVEKLREVFGIHSIVICYKIDKDLDSIKAEAVNLLSKLTFNSFKQLKSL